MGKLKLMHFGELIAPWREHSHAKVENSMLGRKRLLKFAALGAAAFVAGCGGADEVASPGEGVFNPPPTGGGGTVTPPPGTPAADCPTGFADLGTVAGGTLRNCQLPNSITGALTVPLRAGTVYSVSGRVDVGIDRGGDATAPVGTAGQLTVQAGVRVFGSNGLDYIVVNRGSQIFATGTSTNPVIFTSRQSVEGSTTENSIGQWGGLVILGRARISNCPGATPAAIYGTAACQAQVEGTNAFYGGNSASDNSGVLQYVRVMHSGFELAPGNELNGITFAGVGSGTTVDHVQVHNSSDDGVEFFGGNVNVKHLVLTGNDDDSIDTDQGYLGAIQFAVVRQRTGGGNRIIEASMAALATTNPRSRPVLANFTFIGSTATAADAVAILNTGTDYRFYNGLITTAKTTAPCLDIDNTPDSTAIFRSVFMSCTVAFASDVDTVEEATTFGSGTNNNTANGTSTLNGITNGANEAAVPVVTFSTLADAELPAAIKAFLTQVNYVGAVQNSTDTWYAGWTCGLPGGANC